MTTPALPAGSPDFAIPYRSSVLAAISLLLTGAIFGFFYAYSVSVMWGLDASDGSSAIAAMQGINRVVRNAAFAPAFFGAPLLLLLTAGSALRASRRGASAAFALAALAYLMGAFLPTYFVNIPMNQALASLATPAESGEAALAWHAYSDPWTLWNHIRTAASGVALLAAGSGILLLGRRN
ncbi:membrane protein [Mesorhizobium sp. L-8-10]|uniref:anthrone oxygenase family protein n=1 Tax=Mesorhizobium sp. L-8-10 TaxID=2744523 RepID=UPI001926094D|nr:anthrone oxygenase family protein [Mesorhizobium sp. L-8-10]BCH31992.1 membrane protein [Mesorhizobium sp. L-8-10]